MARMSIGGPHTFKVGDRVVTGSDLTLPEQYDVPAMHDLLAERPGEVVEARTVTIARHDGDTQPILLHTVIVRLDHLPERELNFLPEELELEASP